MWTASAASDVAPWAGQRALVVKIALDGTGGHGPMLRREARFLSRLVHANVIRLWHVGVTDDGRDYLVLSAAQGTLADRLKGAALTVSETLTIGQGIARALEAAHRKAVVHRDVKPSNVLLSSEQTVWLSDFGLAEDLSLADLGLGLSRVAGSLLYAAPEQTGMLRREVDGRADLYSLGVVLFECLAGRPPFQGDEPEALLQLHAAARPPDVRLLRAEVPEGLAFLIARLLAKDPDDRYPSARSVLRELGRLGRDEPPAAEPPGRDEVGPPPFGRELQVAEIRAAVAALATGHGRTLCVTGDEGSGRRHVCEAALAETTEARVLATGRADADATPYAPFRALVARLVEQARREPEGASLTREALARHGAALSRLFPGLEGLPAPREELSVDLALDALVRMLSECGTPRRPVVLLFEAADRLGAAERGVLRRLHMQAQVSPLLLLCTGEGKPFSDAEHAVPELHLAPLAREAVEQVVRHVLGSQPFPARLTELSASVSGGNPRALHALLAQGLAEGVIETDGARWCVDEARFVALDGPEASEQGAIAAVRMLDEGSLSVLRAAALLGRRFDPRWLELVGCAPRRIEAALWEGIQRRVLSTARDGEATFANGAVRDALARDVPEDEQRRVHAAIVAGLDARAQLTRSEREVLALAHLATVSDATARRAWERCLEAGLSELDAFAFRTARTLLDAAQALAERFALASDFRLPRALAQLDAQGGDVQAAIAKLSLAIDSCPDAVERATMHARCAELSFFSVAHTGPMREHLAASYRELGEQMPEPSPFSALWALVFALGALFIELTGFRRGVDGVTQTARTRLRVCELTGMYYFFTQEPLSTLRTCMRGWYYGRRSGPCRELGYGVLGLSNFLEILGFKRRAEAYYREALELAERLGDAGLFAYARYMRAIGFYFTRDSQRGERLLMQAFERHGGELDIAYLGQSAANLVSSAMVRGDVRRAEQILARVRAQVEARFGQHAALPETCIYGELDVLLQTGHVARAEEVALRLKERLLDPQSDPLGWLNRLHSFATYEFSRGARDEEVDRVVREAARSPLRPPGSTWLTGRTWVMIAYVRLAQLERAAPEERSRRAALFLESLAKARRVRKSPYLDGHIAVLEAAGHHLRGHVARAERALVRAEAEAHRRDAPAVLVEARALRARMLLDLGHDAPARSEARCAAALAEAAGLTARAREIERAFVLARAPSADGQGSTRSRDLGSLSNVQRERDALLEVTVAASRELEPRAQARAVLDRLIALLGAERGLIFGAGPDGVLTRLSGRGARHEDLPDDVRYARSLVQRVHETASPLVLSGTEEGAGLGSESMVAGNLRSMVCAPIRLGDQTRGVIYLDSSLARGVFTRRDLEILDAMGSQIALTQEMARSARMQVERLALEKDLQLSGAVQSLFLPTQREVNLGAVTAAAAYVPVSHSGGDFWSYERRPDGRVWVLVADATGHGAGAAMVTAVLAGSYRTLVELGVDSLPDVLTELNRTISALCAGRHAATATALEISADGARVGLWSAGGPPVLVRAPEGEVDSHVLRGTPLGSAGFLLGARTFELSPEARLLLVTDGILEMPTEAGRELGARRLMKLFARHGAGDVRGARDALVDAVVQLRGAAEVEDDLTLLVVGR